MQITREFAEAEIRNLQQQERQLFQMSQQAAGARIAFEAIIKRMEEPEPDGDEQPEAKKETKK